VTATSGTWDSGGARIAPGPRGGWYIAIGDSAHGPFETKGDAVEAARAEGMNVVSVEADLGGADLSVPLPNIDPEAERKAAGVA
jgi:hypothetical protein